MTDLAFAVESVAPEPYAAAPGLTARVRIEVGADDVVHALALRCQVRIWPQRRRYGDNEEADLLDLFGSRERWSSTLRPFLWMHCSAMVQGFTGRTTVDLPMPCTYDFEVAASKYLHALETAGAPVSLAFMFSGTVFTKGPNGFGVEQIPWDRDATYDMPVQVWRELVRAHFPNAGWIRVDHAVVQALTRYKSAHGLLTFDEAVSELLKADGEVIA